MRRPRRPSDAGQSECFPPADEPHRIAQTPIASARFEMSFTSTFSTEVLVMKKLIRLSAGPVAFALLCVVSVSPSFAVTTTFASGAGTDSPTCGSRVQPCRSISYALYFAQAGGVVSCLDAGPYTENLSGPDPFTLDCPGVLYGFGNPIIALSGGSSQVVTVRNVIFDGG